MIPPSQMKTLARARLRDAKALFRAGRYDAAAYISGYAVEIALKARISRTLRWDGFPETQSEWEGLQGLKTHKLPLLLRFSGQEPRIRERYITEWNNVMKWDPIQRYLPPGSTAPGTVEAMLRSVQVLVRVL